MLDDQREVFAVAAFRLGLRPEHDRRGRARPDRSTCSSSRSRCSGSTPTDDIGDMTSGDAVDHPRLVRRLVPDDRRQAERSSTSSRARARSAAPTRWSSCPGAPHPIAANLWINFNLDAQISAANTNYIGYMGPNAAAEQYIDHDDPGRPDRQPAAGHARQAGRAGRPRRRGPRQVHPALERAPGLTWHRGVDAGRRPPAARRRRRDLDRPAGGPRPSASPGRLRRCPASSGWRLLPRAARDHPRRQPRVARRRAATSSSTSPSLQNYLQATRSGVPAGVRELAPLRR